MVTLIGTAPQPHVDGPPLGLFIIFLLALICILYYRYRRELLAHEERRSALEKMLPLPPKSPITKFNPYLLPMMLLGFGIGLGVIMSLEGERSALGACLMVVLPAVGWIIAIKLNRREREKVQSRYDEEYELYQEALRNKLMQSNNTISEEIPSDNRPLPNDAEIV
jgi:hypothetical protein